MRAARAVALTLAGVVLFPFWLLPQLYLLLGVASLTGVVHAYRIPSSSMEPTLRCSGDLGCTGSTDDRVLALRYLLGAPGRGDIVVFRAPAFAAQACGAGGVFVKRVIGLPGDRLTEEGGTMYVNGRRLDEPYVQARDPSEHGETRVRPGTYYVLGDRRTMSCDSRDFGPVDRGAILGYVALTYWPTNRIAFD